MRFTDNTAPFQATKGLFVNYRPMVTGDPFVRVGQSPGDSSDVPTLANISNDTHHPSHHRHHNDHHHHKGHHHHVALPPKIADGPLTQKITKAKPLGIDPSTLPPKLFAEYEQKRERIMREVSLSNDRWEYIDEHKGLKLWIRTEGDYNYNRSTVRADLSQSELIKYFEEPGFRTRYDSMVRSVNEVERQSPQCCLVQVVAKGVFPVSDRDFAVMALKYWQDEDTFVFLGYDAEVLEYPEQPGCVRGSVEFSGIVLKKLDAHSTEILTFSKSNPRIRGVPNWILRSAAKDQGRIPLKMIKLIKKLKAKEQAG